MRRLIVVPMTERIRSERAPVGPQIEPTGPAPALPLSVTAKRIEYAPRSAAVGVHSKSAVPYALQSAMQYPPVHPVGPPSLPFEG